MLLYYGLKQEACTALGGSLSHLTPDLSYLLQTPESEGPGSGPYSVSVDVRFLG